MLNLIRYDFNSRMYEWKIIYIFTCFSCATPTQGGRERGEEKVYHTWKRWLRQSGAGGCRGNNEYDKKNMNESITVYPLIISFFYVIHRLAWKFLLFFSFFINICESQIKKIKKHIINGQKYKNKKWWFSGLSPLGHGGP